jgi:hypothetical protein
MALAQTARLKHEPAPALQRRCACGGTPGPDGECAACKAKRLAREAAAPAATPVTLSPGPGHAFERVPVEIPRPPRATRASGAAGLVTTEMPLDELPPDPDLALLEGGGAADAGAPAPADAGASPASCCKLRSFTASGDTYDDKATSSRKTIRFDVGVDYGSDPQKCVLVNWVQGTAKKKDGTFLQAMLFDKVEDINFPTSRIDSVDKDPVYWSKSSGRWNYKFTVGTGDQFYATDSPGPPAWEDGMDFDLKFKMCAYCIDDVSTTSSAAGSGVKNPLQCIDWVFKAKYDAAAKKFTH